VNGGESVNGHDSIRFNSLFLSATLHLLVQEEGEISDLGTRQEASEVKPNVFRRIDKDKPHAGPGSVRCRVGVRHGDLMAPAQVKAFRSF
jgi:hypothetical protein